MHDRSVDYDYHSDTISYRDAAEQPQILQVRIKKEKSASTRRNSRAPAIELTSASGEPPIPLLAREKTLDVPVSAEEEKTLAASLAPEKVLDLELRLTPEQHTQFLRTFGHHQKGLSNETSSYTTIFQHNLSRFNYEKISARELSAPELRKTDSLFSFLVKNGKLAHYKISIFVNKHLDFSEAKETQVQKLMDTLRFCSEQFADLEALINNPPSDDLYDAIEILKEKAEVAYSAIFGSLGIYERDCKKSQPVMEALRTTLGRNHAAFLENIESQKQILNHENPLSLIFDMQMRESETRALGSFVAQQIIHLCAGGIEEVYRIGEGRGPQAWQTHSAIKFLSNTKSALNARARSLHGVSSNNSRLPYSPEVIASLKPSALLPGQTDTWVRVTDYVEQGLANIEEIDKILCVMTNQPIHDKKSHDYEFALKIALFLASAVEFVVYSTIHLLFTAVAFTLELMLHVVPYFLFATLYAVLSLTIEALMITFIVPTVLFAELFRAPGVASKANEAINYVHSKFNLLRENFNVLFAGYTEYVNIQAVDETAESLHHELSLVRYVRYQIEKGYERTDKNSHGKILDNLKGHGSSFYNQILSHYSGHFLTTSLIDFLMQTILSTTTIVREVFFLLQPKSPKKRQNVFDERKAQVEKLKQQIHVEAQTPAGRKKLDELMQARAVEKEHWYLMSPQPINAVPSPIAVPDELIVGFVQKISEPALRNDGWVATGFAMFAMLTLGTLLAPDTIKLKALGDFCAALSKGFGQDIVGKSAMHQLVGVSLEWQMTYFGFGLTQELWRGGAEKIKWLLNNSEKLVLMLAGSMVAGTVLKNLPLVPEDAIPKVVEFLKENFNFVIQNVGAIGVYLDYSGYFLNGFVQAVNTFIVESKAADCGAPPFNLFTQAVYAIKASLIVHSLVTKPQPDSHYEAERQQKQLCVLASEEIEFKENENFQEEPILVPEDEKKIAKTPLLIAYEELRDAISVADEYSQLKAMRHYMNPRKIEEDPAAGETRAALYFDYLTEKFDRYNEELEKEGFYELKLDDALYQKDYLHSFYNRYCYKGTTTIIQLITLALFYPAALLYRAFKYTLASTEPFYAPSIKQQIKMDFAAELALVFQIGGIIAWTLKGTVRLAGYMLRAIIGAPVIIIAAAFAGLIYGPGAIKPCIKKCMDFISHVIVPHRFNGTFFLWPAYARVTRLAGTNSEDLSDKKEKLLAKLERDQKSIAEIIEARKRSHSQPGLSDNLIIQLTEYRNGVKGRILQPTAATRDQQVKLVARVAHNPTLTDQEKKDRVTPVLNRLSFLHTDSRLRHAISVAVPTTPSCSAGR